jgi:hypothetical protein
MCCRSPYLRTGDARRTGARELGIGVLILVDELQEASTADLVAINTALHLGQAEVPLPLGSEVDVAIPASRAPAVVRDTARLPAAEGLRAPKTVVDGVARAVNDVVATERTYVCSMGSMQGNVHIHWHIASLPAGVRYREQYHALMAENGSFNNPHRNRRTRCSHPVCDARDVGRRTHSSKPAH